MDGVGAEGFDLFAELAKALFAAGGNNEVGSVTGESDGCRPTYASTGSSYEGGFTSEVYTGLRQQDLLLSQDGSIRLWRWICWWKREGW